MKKKLGRCCVEIRLVVNSEFECLTLEMYVNSDCECLTLKVVTDYVGKTTY